MKYTNFTIRARDWNDGRFRVEVLNSPTGRMRTPVEVIYNAQVMEPFLEKLLNTSARTRMKQAEWIKLGQALAAMLLPSKVRLMLLVSLGAISDDEGLRVQLVLDDPEAARLPWEYVYLHEEDTAESLSGFLALNPRTPIVRHESYSGGVMGSTKVDGALKVYVGFAAPTDSKPLDFEAERGHIEAGLREAFSDNRRFELTIQDHMQAQHLEADATGVHIFHYGGHGGFCEKANVKAAKDKAARVDNQTAGNRAINLDRDDDLDRANTLAKKGVKDGIGVLFLEDEDGEKRIFDAEDLGTTLRGAGVRVVVMDACKSARRDRANVWTGIAPLLMRYGIPGAVGMQYSILDKAALSFSRLLYHSLGVGMPLEEAVTRARIAIQNTEPLHVNGTVYDASWDWGLPVLYLRAENGVVFPELTSDPTLEAERKEILVEQTQMIEDLKGKALVAEVGEIEESVMKLVQKVKRVGPGGEASVAKIDHILKGTRLKGEHNVKIAGEGSSVVGVKVGKIGGPSRSCHSERRESTTPSKLEVPPSIPQKAVYHVAVGDQQTGPHDVPALRQQAEQGKLTRNSLVWTEGMDQWKKAGEVAELQSLFASEPPPLPTNE